MKYLLLFTTLFFSAQAYSGCNEDENAACFYYKAGNLVKEGLCKFETCANIHSLNTTWTWRNKNTVNIAWSEETDQLTINDKPAFMLPFGLSDEKLHCYGINGSDENLCVKTNAW